MRVSRGGGSPKDSRQGGVPQGILDIAINVFRIAPIIFFAILGYMIYGLVTGELSHGPKVSKAEAQHLFEVSQNLSTGLIIAAIVSIIATSLVYYQEESLGIIFLAMAAFFAFGFQFALDLLGGANNMKAGSAATHTIESISQLAYVFGIPGGLLLLRSLAVRFNDARAGVDLTAVTYGAGTKKESRPRPLVPALARCWELPFCRESIRDACPIFQAKTKCWKQRVGCMCEENIIALSNHDSAKSGLANAGGFVPIGDLLSSTPEQKQNVQFRLGPRGIKIPTNPYLSDADKRERCRNCIIYNEHQRLKYNLLAPLVTLAAPVVIYLYFDVVKGAILSGIGAIEGLVKHVSITGEPAGIKQVTQELSGSLPVVIFAVCAVGLIVVSYVNKFLEYCIFKLKI